MEKVNEKTRDAILKFALEYKEKRANALSGENEEELKNKLEAIRKHSIGSLSEIKSRAVMMLQENGFVVYEAKDAKEAVEKIKDIMAGSRLAVKSKSNVLDEIKLKESIKTEIVETDLGDFINQFTGNEDMHPVIPALNLTPKEIAAAIKAKFKINVEAEPEAIMAFAREYLREKIKTADVGLTGANVITADGKVVLLENEGNISLVSRMPEKHIIVAGIEKFAENVEEAMHVVKCSAIWGTGQKWPAYVSVIAGPSKTGDIQNRHITGAQGAKEAHVILLDNGRTKMISQGSVAGAPNSPSLGSESFGELLQCIGCGACLDFCPAFHQLGSGFGCETLGGIKGISSRFVKDSHQAAFDSGAFRCLTCLSCKINCPAKIDFSRYILKVRTELAKEGLEPDKAKEMLAKMREFGNPFGKPGEAPKELYCC